MKKADFVNARKNGNSVVARAVRRALGLKSVEVDGSTVKVVVKGQNYVASLPNKVSALISDVESGEKVSPLAFSIRFNLNLSA